MLCLAGRMNESPEFRDEYQSPNCYVALGCLSLKNPIYESHIRISGEAGEAMSCPGAFGWKHPTRTGKLSDTQ